MELMLGQTPAPRLEPRSKAALLTSAMPGTTEGADWRKGLGYWPESAPFWRVVQDCTDEAVEYGDEMENLPVAARPFVIQTVTHCPKGSIPEMAARAERHIRAVTSAALAHELWTGEATALDPWSLPTGQVALGNQRPDAGTADVGPYLNPHLVGGAEDAGPATSIEEALGLVEAAVEDRLAGGPVYLHVPSPLILSPGLLTLETQGDLIRTPLGSIIVSDSGYPPNLDDESGPSTIYGTGPVHYWLDEPVVYDQDSWVVEPSTNRVAVWAERAALLLFDPQTLVSCTVSP